MPATTVAATVWPMRTGVSPSVWGLARASFSSERAAPEMAGTAIKRLKPTAQAGEKPRTSALATVSPLRLTPGKGANICASPITSASSQVVSAGPLRPLCRARRQVEKSSTDAVMRNPMPAARSLLNVSLIQSMKKSFSGISGRRGHDRQQADPPDRRPVKPRRHVAITGKKAARTGEDFLAVVEKDGPQRAHVEHDVEEQVLLAATRLPGEPGEDLLSDHEVAIARDRKELGDALNNSQNQ